MFVNFFVSLVDVDAIATGTLVRDGRRIELALELADPRSGENLWVNSTWLDFDQISRLASDAAQALGSWILSGDAASGQRRVGRCRG